MAMVLECLEGILSMNNMPYKATVTGDICAPVFRYLREIVKKNSDFALFSKLKMKQKG
jgi:hypothetical protein